MTLVRTPPAHGGWLERHAELKAEREAAPLVCSVESDVRAVIWAHIGNPEVLRRINAMAPRRLEEVIEEMRGKMSRERP